jgi:acetyl-CoA C-acetyltransferase
MVVGAEKMTDASTQEISAALMAAADSEEEGHAGLSFPGIFGIIARRYMHEYGLTRERLNVVSARHHRNALENPFAQFHQELAPEDVARSPRVADPLCLLDCSPVSDGAAACILSTKHASSLRLAASQLSTDTLSITERPTITSFPATRDAGGGAWEEAGIGPSDIQCLELHDCFSIAAVISLEDLGFAEPGRGIELYESEDAGIAINASGGLKACGHPVAATGVKQLIDIGKQMKKTGSRYGLTQNFGGAGATCGIHILEHIS